jgi:hypothetical protein
MTGCVHDSQIGLRFGGMLGGSEQFFLGEIAVHGHAIAVQMFFAFDFPSIGYGVTPRSGFNAGFCRLGAW